MPIHTVAMSSSPIHAASAARSARSARLRPRALMRLGFGLASVMGLGLALGLAGLAQAQTRRASPAPKPVCLVADFRSLALETHDPQQRANASRDWLRANGSACTLAQLGNIASNRAAWLGNADSPALMGMIDGMIEKREATSSAANPASSASPLAVTQAAPAQTLTAGTPPPRIVPPANDAGAVPVVMPVAVPVPKS